MRYGRFPRYVPVSEKTAKAEKTLEKLRKKRPDLAPVRLLSTALARTWWGKSWNRNLERYADYRNRIGRGKSYVRHGAVLDLRIEGGRASALVQGSRAKPYEVVIRISSIKKSNWDLIRKQCRSELRSLPDLLAGKFPKALGDIFLAEGKGLFPTPREISFDCSCPDWAAMCKHVAATLYGIGARLDDDPLLFFTMRQAETGELVSGAVRDKTEDLLARARKKSSRVLEGADLTGLFGIDMEPPPDLPAPSPPSAAKSTRHKSAAADDAAKPEAENTLSGRSATERIEEIVCRHRRGTTVASLEKETGFPRAKIYAIASRLRQQGRISYVAQGVYGPP